MDWETIIKAYPDERDAIQAAKSLRERIHACFEGIPIPSIETPVRKIGDIEPFIADIARVCSRVWREMTGNDCSFDLAGALRSFVSGEEPQGVPEDDRARFMAVAPAAVSRYLFLLREKNTAVVPGSWNRADCPFCGELARMGFDDENGRRLACLACGHSWRVPRLRCPSCGNADHTRLGYFEAEGMDGVRVSFCKECKRYLKVVDTRTRVARDAETEDSLTIELDRLAEKEGFC